MISRTWIIARRELLSFAVGPVTWVTMAAALALAAWIAGPRALAASGGDLSGFTVQSCGIWLGMQMYLAPVLSMRLLSEERRSGTFEALVTAPVSDVEVVVGKFFAAWIVHAVGASIVAAWPLVGVPFGGSPDPGQMFSAWLGLVGTGSVFIAAGTFASSLTSSQMLAGFLAMAFCLLLRFLPAAALAALTEEHVLSRALARANLEAQILDAARGLVDVVNIATQAAMTAALLLFATRTLESRRWQ